MIPQWMIDDYCQRSQDNKLSGTRQLCNEHGFLTYDIDGDTFKMHNVYGDGRYWQNEMEKIAKESGCKKILCGTWRNPNPMCRRYGYKVVGTGTILEKEL